jgi:hypothetical protein
VNGKLCQAVICQAGQYLVLPATTCAQCPTLCATCVSAGGCSSCGRDADYDSDRRFCQCRSQYFLQGQECAVCPSLCLACTASGCTSCLSNFLLANYQCICAAGFFRQQGSCAACAQNCTLCTEANFCTACPQGFSLTNRRCSEILNSTSTKSMRIYVGSAANQECAKKNVRV